MYEADQTEQGVTAATWGTQDEWLLRGIPIWVLDSNAVLEGHQKVHAAEAAQDQIVSEVPIDERESTATEAEAQEDCRSCTNSGYCSRKTNSLE